MATKKQTKERKMRCKIGVMGKAGRSKGIPENLTRVAEIIGKEIANQGCILVTGACMGVPDIAAKAASNQGGLVLGYSPAKNLREHLEPPISYPRPSENMELIFTSYGKIGRNVLSIFECDGVIFIGGGIGTLNEFSIAAHEGKVMGIVTGVGGVIEEIVEKIEREGNGKGGVIIKDKNPKRLVRRVIEEIKKREEKPREEIPITFRNERGRQLLGILHLPKVEKPPAVIICHGFQATKTRRRFVKLARALQKAGILAFRFDFEGCGDSEGDPRELSVGKEVSDLNSAYEALLKECDVAREKVALIGESLGGVVVSLFVAKFSTSIKTLVLLAPAFNQKELFKTWYSQQEIKELKEKGVLMKGEKEIGKDYFLENKNKDYSLVLSKFDFPILIIHGKKDEDVPVSYSQKLAKRFKNITLKVLPKANHKFEDPFSRKKAIKYTVDWLKKYL